MTEPKPKQKRVNIKRKKFATEYLKSGNQQQAGKAAGYTSARSAIHAMKDPEVKKQIDAARKTLESEGIYNLKKAMEEADLAIAFAIETKNANAYAKMVEHKAKLNGLLIERQEIRTSSFQIIIKRPSLEEKKVESTPVELIEHEGDLEDEEDLEDDIFN